MVETDWTADEHFDNILNNLKALNENQDLGNTEAYLIDAFNTDSNACLICIETIGAKEAIWNCEGCFEQFHIGCIQNWIRDGSYQHALATDDPKKAKEIPWNCPKCRKEYKQSDSPTSYDCYCKKTKNPKFDPWIIPHSCNQQCNKLKPCDHSCLMLCHPGPCPPCPKIVQTSCNCSKSSKVPRRCSNKHWSCNKACNKLLQCKQHLCEKICHQETCGECPKTSIQFCQCKRSRKEVLCTETLWKCEQPCNKDLSCGNHKCERVCHSKGCGECPKSLMRSCPCGKSQSQKPCTFDIPPCGDTCEKPLACRIHKCVQRCHFGDCDTCRQIVTKQCRCGQKEKSLPCFVEFTCETKCNKMRNCGKHKCNRKCCDGINCAPCEQVCNKQLSCKNHKCSSLCHAGNCYPCPVVAELKCSCGSSKQKVPCVRSKMDIRVACRQNCKLPAKCHHENIQPHKCHYNNCPPCNLKCDKKMKCGHVCPARCHSAVQTEVIENKDREGPWVALKVKTELQNKQCPDCVVPMPVKCLGNHEMAQVACYRAEAYNCGSKCGQRLACGQHKCQLECHLVEIDENNVNVSCEECELPCELPRSEGCSHECSIGPCHPGRCPDCVQLTKVKCHCDTNFVYVECHSWNRAGKKEKELLKSCKVPCPRNISCGHLCTLICHSGQCSREADCIEKVPIKCQCKTLKKSFLCKELKQEKEKLIEKTVKGKKSTFLKCSDKCEAKKKKETEVETPDQVEINTSSSANFKYSILAFLVLFISILVFYFLF